MSSQWKHCPVFLRSAMADGDNFSEGADLLWTELDEDALLPAGAVGVGRADCRAAWKACRGRRYYQGLGRVVPLFISLGVHDCLIECLRLLQGDVDAKRLAQAGREQLNLVCLRDRRITTRQGHELLAVVVHRAGVPE
jgi:hypothetical protein